MIVLLELLTDGQWHSYTSLAEVVGHSALENQLGELAGVGLPLEKHVRKGVRLRGGVTLLSELEIKDALATNISTHDIQLDCFPIIDSTNSYLMRAHAAGSIHKHVCLAECQLAGRGRRGRQWVSPFGDNIYVSIGWECAGGVGKLQGLSLAVGVALVEQLRQMGVQGLQLKWPNDVLINAKKVCGILVESISVSPEQSKVIVGVGLNVTAWQSNVVMQPHTHLRAHGLSVSKQFLAVTVIQVLAELLGCFPQQGFGMWQQRWSELDAYSNKLINIIGANKEILLEGVAQGVTEDGCLRVLAEDGLHNVSYGDVSLRFAENNKEL